MKLSVVGSHSGLLKQRAFLAHPLHAVGIAKGLAMLTVLLGLNVCLPDSKAAQTIGREWSLGVVGPVIATLGRYAVADEIELARSHAFGCWLNHTTAV